MMFENLQKAFLSVFPSLKDQPALYVDMNELYGRYLPGEMLDPGLTHSFLEALHRSQKVAYSFGGYLENREDLWKGSYMDPDKAVHLGIDVNAPAGTGVAPVHKSTVAKIIHDPDQDGGWGSVIVFQLEKPIGGISYFIYAHLSKGGIRVNVGDVVEAGQVVASLGTPDENGGWYEHLHVQAMTPKAWDMVKDRDDMAAFDGYDSLPDGPAHHLSPDPAPLLR